jgi:hypothetical protein
VSPASTARGVYCPSVINHDSINGNHQAMRDIVDLNNHKGILALTAVRHFDYPTSETIVAVQLVHDGQGIRQVNIAEAKFNAMVSQIHRRSVSPYTLLAGSLPLATGMPKTKLHKQR